MLTESYRNCHLCGHHCGVDRANGETGECGLGTAPLISSVAPHFGEEPELVGNRGSGTIFFAGCNLSCQFCQNWDISQANNGMPVSVDKLADLMLQLQNGGCHNVNLVTPTPFTPSILAALKIARDQELSIPIVYNCGGYESLEALELCDGLIDIYMPDAKYSDPEIASSFSGAADYPEVNRFSLCEMHRQVGDLQVENGIAKRGLLIRHLVLPNSAGNSKGVFRFIADEISTDSYVNVMDQYRPCYRANTLEGMGNPLSNSDYQQALADARKSGLHRGFIS